MTMEWRSDLRRTQSVKSIPSSYDKPPWTDTGLRDKTASVSQLVSRYQTGMKINKLIPATSGDNATGKTKQALSEMTPPPREHTETRLESLMRRNKERDMSLAKTSLSRSKSESSLHNSKGSIETLKAVFESKPTQNKVKGNVRAASVTSTFSANIPVMNGEAEDVKGAAKEQKIPSDKNAKKDAKEDHVTQKVVNQISTNKRKTIAGIDFEKIAASQVEDKRRSIADFRENSFIQTKETLSISVKAISALYLSKVANQDSTRSVYKPGPDQSSESGKRVKLTKLQSTTREMCSACLKPVYQMEKTGVGKHIFHKVCFCCKVCKKTLSMNNYAPLNGEFFCIFHYQQLFKQMGNYDEGFGYTQHKNRWLLKNTASKVNDESDA
ncbi:LIM domain-containing protein isoform X3 [Melanotaenia boesemani]|uniref:LIM domain-containing protein isoform X3 n=1 Tax=Melanotaenia boesemani TaxID=1250792 RepID=UPI001C059554|nr:LIM domain-containing protein isoform X3 [Melanotaenia boesemani]